MNFEKTSKTYITAKEGRKNLEETISIDILTADSVEGHIDKYYFEPDNCTMRGVCEILDVTFDSYNNTVTEMICYCYTENLRPHGTKRNEKIVRLIR